MHPLLILGAVAIVGGLFEMAERADKRKKAAAQNPANVNSETAVSAVAQAVPSGASSEPATTVPQASDTPPT